MERWTFLVIAAPDGEPAQIRVRLRTGDDDAAWPTAQVALDGTEVPPDEVAHDYEAPEWKAAELLEGGGGAARLEQLKEGLRSTVGS